MIFLVLASLILGTSAYSCANQTVLNFPSDLTNPLFYPAEWSGEQPVPQLDENQSCFIVVNVPSGYYANVTFYREIPYQGGSYVLYSNNKFKMLYNDHDPFIFSFPYFKVSFGTGNTPETNGQFAFKVVYTKFPVVTKKSVNIYPGKPPVALSPNNQLTTFIGNPNSMMCLMGFSLADPSMNNLLRQTMLFGGSSFNDDFIGTLEQLLDNEFALTAYGNKISVYTFGLNNVVDYPMFMGQDSQDARQFQKYVGANCPSTGDCLLTLKGMYGNSMVVTDYEGSEFIKSFDAFPDTATVTVYENYVSNTTRVATLTSDNYLQQLPLEVKGNMKFYEISGYGARNMTITRDVTSESN